MNRRHFLKLFAAASTGVALAPYVPPTPEAIKSVPFSGLIYVVDNAMDFFPLTSRATYPILGTPNADKLILDRYKSLTDEFMREINKHAYTK